MATNAIGLDIGSSSVRAAQLSATRGQVRLDAIGQVALPHGVVRDGEVVDAQAVSTAISQLWKHSKLNGKRVALGIASSRVIVRQVDIPWLPSKELKQSLSFVVEDLLPVSVDQVYLDFCPLEKFTTEGTRMARGLLVAAPKELIRANVAAVQAAGLKPTAVDLAPFAVLRTTGVIPRSRTAEDTYDVACAVVEIGASTTSVIVHEHGVPRFVRIVAMGGNTITEAVAERLGIDISYAEAIKQELSVMGYVNGLRDGAGEVVDNAVVDRAIDSCLNDFITEIRGSLEFYGATATSPVSQVVLSGGGARLRGLGERLAAAVELPVYAGAPLTGVAIGNTGLSETQIDFLASLSAVPVGLALGALA